MLKCFSRDLRKRMRKSEGTGSMAMDGVVDLGLS